MEDQRSSVSVSLKLLPLLALALGVFAVLLANGASEKASAAGVATTLRAGNSSKCLAVYPGYFFNGATTYQWTCGNSNNIEVEDAGGGWHYIKFVHSGKCLTVNGYAWWDGATLDQWDCQGQSNQKWSGTFVGSVFEVHASQANPTKCITVHGESTANGAWVNQWQCVYRANQAWIMENAAPTPTPTRTRTVTPTATATLVPGDGELTILKECNPETEDQFVIRVGGVVQGTIGCGESIGPITLAAGTYRVSESGSPGNDDEYEVDFDGDCDNDGDVLIHKDDELTCTIVNTVED